MKQVFFLLFTCTCLFAKANNADTTKPLPITVHYEGTTTVLNQPLYVVNGKEIEDSISTNFIKRLDINLIEKVEVLKDAKATSLYGAKGINGVIIITTKQTNFAPKSPFRKPPGFENDNYTL